jgi:endonuclease/exonuclease/phosphatase family metal-dependent hydrolase
MATRRRRSRKNSRNNRWTPPPNDNISRNFVGKVPKRFEGTDQFLDIVSWNIKFFSSLKRTQMENVKTIMAEMNADIFVCQEIEPGSLDEVASHLNQLGLGGYKTAYGSTGGDQRVAFLYDAEWVQSSLNIHELFPEGVTASDGKEAFPRRPPHTLFAAATDSQPIDFHLVGVHLKSKRGGGGPQRRASGDKLAEWLTGPTIEDEDVIILGDWNNTANASDWTAIKALEAQGKAVFEGRNEGNEGNHFFANGRSSRIDLVLTSPAMQNAASDKKTHVVKWSDFAANSTFLTEMINEISDHLPVISRFVWSDED